MNLVSKGRLTSLCTFQLILLQMYLDRDALKKIIADDGKTLNDLLALEIGNIGENMLLRRAVFVKVDDPLVLGSYVHSAGIYHV